MAKYHDRKKKTVSLEVNIVPNKRLFMVKYHDRKKKLYC